MSDELDGLFRVDPPLQKQIDGLVAVVGEMGQQIESLPRLAREEARLVIDLEKAELADTMNQCRLMLRALIDATEKAVKLGVPFSQADANEVGSGG